jgi:hypothetical protein
MGDPKATDMPAAAAAESTSRFLATAKLVSDEGLTSQVLPSLLLILSKRFMNKFAQQHAT